jgi:hypothetical protein
MTTASQIRRAVRAALAYRDLWKMPEATVRALSSDASIPNRMTVHFDDCQMVVSLPYRQVARVVLMVPK